MDPGRLDDIKEFLEQKVLEYNHQEFIASDPVLIPHQYSDSEDIEIAAFLTATISWGRRSQIIRKALELLHLLGNQPHDFVVNASPEQLRSFREFQHRTFQGLDAEYFMYALQHIYRHHDGLQMVFERSFRSGDSIFNALARFRDIFLSLPGPLRTRKHIPDVLNGAAAKRLNMFLRWMVRSDARGVDFGLWTGIPASALMIPLDVHTGNVARKLGLLTRKQNDWKAVEELTSRLRDFDPNDPVKYDYALFGLGMYENF
jgi:uncharacterized protein (TIGR02757 family)